MTVEFDSIAEMGDRAYENPLGEAAALVSYLEQNWDTEPDVDGCKVYEWEGETVRIVGDVFDHVESVIHFLWAFTIPKSIHVERDKWGGEDN